MKHSNSERITISTGQVEQISEQYKLLAGRTPSLPELRALVDDFVDEEVAYREAIALGLDFDDTIVRRRMRQKLEFLTLDIKSNDTPTRAELSEWLNTHAQNYRVRERIRFRQILASHDKRGDQAQQTAKEFKYALILGEKFDTLGDSSMLPSTIPLSTRKEVATLFGKVFADEAFAAHKGLSSPIQSAYGYHLISKTEHQRTHTPQLDDIFETVKADWIEAKKQEARDTYLENLRQRYAVQVQWPAKYIAPPSNP